MRKSVNIVDRVEDLYDGFENIDNDKLEDVEITYRVMKGRDSLVSYYFFLSKIETTSKTCLIKEKMHY